MSVELMGVDCVGPVTVAFLRHRDGRVEQLHFDGAADLPSGVFQTDGGQLLTGRTALDASTSDPDRYVAAPLHLLASPHPDDDGTRATAIVAALLGRVREQASQAAGVPVVRAVVIVPPRWGSLRGKRLREAAHRAGLTDIEMVDAATALALHHADPPTPGSGYVLVLRLAGLAADATILNSSGRGLDLLATVSTTDLADLAAAEQSEQAVALTTRALAAAELASSAITTTVLLAPAPQVPAVAAGLRHLGITTAVRTAAVTDAVRAALNRATAQTTAPPRRLRQARHAVAAAIPLAGAAVLLWLLLRTAVSPRSPLASYLTPVPGEGVLTLWPAWSMVCVLVYCGAVALVLRRADQRLRRSTPDTEAERRTILAGGLRITAGTTAAAGVVTAMLGATTYPTMPIAALVVWSVVPSLLLAAVATLIARLVHDGHTSALRWQIWLRMPNTTVVLGTVGLLLIHADLYARQSLLADLAIAANPRLPTGLDRLGAIAVALAVLPLLARRTSQQVLYSPVIVAVVLLTHSYTNTNLVIGALLAAIGLWWIIRIRPVGAYNNPEHPASIQATELGLAPTTTVSAQ